MNICSACVYFGITYFHLYFHVPNPNLYGRYKNKHVDGKAMKISLIFHEKLSLSVTTYSFASITVYLLFVCTFYLNCGTSGEGGRAYTSGDRIKVLNTDSSI